MGNNTRQNMWVFHNATAGLSNGNELQVGGNMMTATIEILGTGTSKVIFEGKANDGGAFYPIMGVNLKDLTTAYETTAKGVLYQVSLEGLIAFRVRINNYVALETVTVKSTIVN